MRPGIPTDHEWNRAAPLILPNIPQDRDPLGVLTSTKPVVEHASDVWVDPVRLAAVADELATAATEPPAWNDDLHFRDSSADWRTAGGVFVLDALNFCFWSAGPDPNNRWRVTYRGERYDGYWALAAALRRAVDERHPLWDPAYLAAITPAQVTEILRPDPGSPDIPLFAERVANLQELGRGLLALDAGDKAAAVLITMAQGSAARLVGEVVHRFPSFNDVASYRGREVRFYKRAQILIADLIGSFAGEGLGAFTDLDTLTAFADYKVPQVLRRLGILTYSPALAAIVDARTLIPAGSPMEVEIRAGTIWACELLRRALTDRGRILRAFEVDWLLWSAGQSLPPDTRPYHRTITIFY
jgi:hypothetical protein